MGLLRTHLVGAWQEAEQPELEVRSAPRCPSSLSVQTDGLCSQLHTAALGACKRLRGGQLGRGRPLVGR